MTTDAARKLLVWSSIIMTGTLFVFFILAPALGFPLTFEEGIRLLELDVPIFVGYLGSATQFVFHQPKQNDPELPVVVKGPLVGLLIVGPLVLFVLANIAGLLAFGISNRPSATPGTGMNVDLLAVIISAALSILAVTTNVAVAYLFGQELKR